MCSKSYSCVAISPHITPQSSCRRYNIYAIISEISGPKLIFAASYGKVARELLEKVALKYHRNTRQQRRIDRVLLKETVDIGAVAAQFACKPRYASLLSR